MIDLKSKTISGIKWTSVSSLSISLLQLIQVSILARYLQQSDFGLMAMAMVTIGFSQMFIDIGISNALIFYQSPTKNQLSTLYWLNIMVGFILFLISISTADLISEFYNEPELTKIIFIVSFSFLIIPLGQLYQILLQRDLHFNIVSKIDIISKTISFVTCVTLAILDFGVYSIVYGNLLSIVISTSMLIYHGQNLHKPNMNFKFYEITYILRFGLFQIGEKIINYGGYQLDSIIIGKLLGAKSLGLYSTINSLSLRPSQAIIPIVSKVTFPLMSKTNDDNYLLKKYYLKTINYLAMILFPMYFLIFIFPEQILTLLLGPKWLNGTVLFQIFSIYVLLRSMSSPIGNLLMSKGKAQFAFIYSFLFFIMLSVSIYIGSLWGLLGIGCSLTLLHLLILFVEWRLIIYTICHANFLDYFKQIIYPAIFVLIPAIICSISYLLFSNKFLIFTFGLIVFFISYFFIIYKFKKEFILDIILLIPSKFNKWLILQKKQ